MKRSVKIFTLIVAVMTAAVFSSAVYAEDHVEHTDIYDNIEICTVDLDSVKTDEGTESSEANVSGGYKTLFDAEEAAGFYFDGSYGNPEGLPLSEYTVNDGIMQIRYYNNSGDERTVRMAEGSGDISGDNTEYLAVQNEMIKNCDVTIKGTSCGYYLATWAKGSYSFSIRSNYPMSAEELESAVEEIILA